MNMAIVIVAVVVAVAVLLLVSAGSSIRLGFYRAYFQETQVIAGRDPDDVLRSVFPKIWRWIR